MRAGKYASAREADLTFAVEQHHYCNTGSARAYIKANAVRVLLDDVLDFPPGYTPIVYRHVHWVR